MVPAKEEVERPRKSPKAAFDQPVQCSASVRQKIMQDQTLRQMEPFVEGEDGEEAEDSEVNPLVTSEATGQ